MVVGLGDDIEGFVPVSHSGVNDADRLEEHYGAGDTVSLRVIESDAANRRIVLEVTEVPERKSQEEIEQARIAAAEAAAAAAAAASAAEADDDDEYIKPRVSREVPEAAEGTLVSAAAAGANDAPVRMKAEKAEAEAEAAAEADEPAEAEAEEPAEAEAAADDAEAEDS